MIFIRLIHHTSLDLKIERDRKTWKEIMRYNFGSLLIFLSGTSPVVLRGHRAEDCWPGGGFNLTILVKVERIFENVYHCLWLSLQAGLQGFSRLDFFFNSHFLLRKAGAGRWTYSRLFTIFTHPSFEDCIHINDFGIDDTSFLQLNLFHKYLELFFQICSLCWLCLAF